jgi:hypothetical protein
MLWRPDGVLHPGRPMNAVVEDLKKQIAQVGSISADGSRSDSGHSTAAKPIRRAPRVFNLTSA